ncbi:MULTISPECIES: PepSY-associated TM helix domain-containing protein [unclassified Arcicella]|uniref:PepSY-associated TM helix domain-containing protein n=1 Tax=unclassified Arcicella TaxID=2644986 RepID=UPI00285B0D78|nr:MULTISPECIES: PepSY-associated TM helix domain-containing protein [unclassified Arcicella]MDR6562004.1 putative iron-regulated membrane protein [Arcicella sp. BE51]MDR6811876.1 putative iron-regulated membrane protein [Arcicella sp. BE140]MDR6822906.1 putative iron-regulated membrane protein [Arcicella sp. BE139]
MKLKGLSNRAFNIFLHTHTVAGIVISFALYIIFFAGAFTIFRSEIYQWENPSARIQLTENSLEYDQIIEKLKQQYPEVDTEKDIIIRPGTTKEPLTTVWVSMKDKVEKNGNTRKEVNKARAESLELSYHPVNKTLQVYEGKNKESPPTTIGETLFRLHYFSQIPIVGMYLAGFVAFFFLFASITGVLIHWRNIITKFYGFSIKGAWKQIWTNAHTVFGLIGLPFQMMYAVTGAFYCLSILLLAPATIVFFNGDQKAALTAFRPDRVIEVNEKSPINTNLKNVNSVVNKFYKTIPDIEVTRVTVKHLGREDAILTAYVQDETIFNGYGVVGVTLKDGKRVMEVLPREKTYTQAVLGAIGAIHFAEFGGIALKIMFFILAFITCFIIISGVLIWKEARNKKEYTDKQKRFHHRITMWYLAICFGLFPATAILFIAERVIPMALNNHSSLVNTVFFVSWLILMIVGLFSKKESILTKRYLYINGVLSLIVPIANGVTTGDWLWKSLANQQFYVAAVDIFWLLVASISFFLATSIYGKSDKVEKTKKGSAVLEKPILS